MTLEIPDSQETSAEPAAEAPAAEAPAVEAPVAEAPVAETPAVEATGVEVTESVEPAVDETEDVVETDEAEAAEPAPSLGPASPYDLPGGWYVVHSYSGYEKKVKANLETRVKSMHLEDRVFPGYILVRLYMDDDTWYAVRNTPGVTGFVGSGSKPTPLSRREVERILGVRKEEEPGAEKKEPTFKPIWEVGETIRVVEGPFADFNGVIEDINVDQSKVRVLVDIFGRETPVELNFDQILKY